MRVKDVMVRDVATISVATPFKQIAELLLSEQAGGLPVVGPDGTPVGMVTESDLMSKVAFMHTHHGRVTDLLTRIRAGHDAVWMRKADGLTAADVMSAPVLTSTPDEDIHEVSRRMLHHGVKRLAVVDGVELAGMITRRDVLLFFHTSDERVQKAVEETLYLYLYTIQRADIRVSVDDGVVHLGGMLPSDADVRLAELIASRVDGVIAVRNELGFEWRSAEKAAL